MKLQGGTSVQETLIVARLKAVNVSLRDKKSIGLHEWKPTCGKKRREIQLSRDDFTCMKPVVSKATSAASINGPARHTQNTHCIHTL